jgi:hypothetical protein
MTLGSTRRIVYLLISPGDLYIVCVCAFVHIYIDTMCTYRGSDNFGRRPLIEFVDKEFRSGK